MYLGTQIEPDAHVHGTNPDVRNVKVERDNRGSPEIRSPPYGSAHARPSGLRTSLATPASACDEGVTVRALELV